MPFFALSTDEGSARFIKIAVLLGLCFQNCTHALLTRYSRSILREDWSEYEVVMMSELLKFVAATFLMVQDSGSDSDAQGAGMGRLVWLLWNGKKVVFLVLGYVLSNVLAYVALQRVDASVYTVLGQLKLFTTAAFSMCFLQTVLSGAKIRALVLLSLGCILVTSPSFNKPPPSCDAEAGMPSEGDSLSYVDATVGVISCLIMVVISGAANVYLEKILKKDEVKLTIWERNVQLAFYSWVVVMAVCAFNYTGMDTVFSLITSAPSSSAPEAVLVTRAPFEGWSMITVLVCIVQAAGGILVAATLKYADAIVKNFAVSGSIMLSTILGYFWLGGIVDLFVLIGCVATILALFNYALDATPPQTAASGTNGMVAMSVGSSSSGNRKDTA